MRLARPAIALGAALLVATTTPSLAAAKPKAPKPPAPVSITDISGDANALNSQDVGLPVNNTATPVQVAGADITSITWTSLVTVTKVRGKLVNVPAGFKVKMGLSAAPQPNVIFRVTTTAGPCATFWFNYSTFYDGGTSASLQHDCPDYVASSATSATESDPVDSVTVDSTGITWTMKAKSLPKSIRAGTKFTELSGHSRTEIGTSLTGGATVPSLDEIAGDKTFVYGS